MKFFEKMYVGFQRARYHNSETPRLLGFAVPQGTTKAEKNRMSTVDRWSGKEEPSRVIDNKPSRGFKLLEVVSRYSTSNKLFRVLDPRGFELEISSDNLLELAMNSTIVKGEIVEECVWAQHNGVYLMPTSDERYKFWVKGLNKPKSKIEAGKYYVNVGNLLSVFRFEGIFHHTYLDVRYFATDVEKSTREIGVRFGHNIADIYTAKAYETHVDIMMNTGNKPTYVYTEFLLDEDGNVAKKEVHFRKSHMKNLDVYDDVSELHSDVLEFEFDTMRNLKTEEEQDGVYYRDYKLCSAYFKNKKDAKEFDYSDIIKDLKPDGTWRYSVDFGSVFDNTNFYYRRIEKQVALDAKRTFKVVDKR